MKKNTFIYIILLLITAFTVLFSCKKNDDSNPVDDSIEDGIGDIDEPLPTILELANTVDELSDFIKAIEIVDTDVVTLLSIDGSNTIFAPTNEAFDAFFDELEGFESLNDFDEASEIELLTQFLKYHIITNIATFSSDLSNEQVLNTIQGEELIVNINTSIFIQDKTNDVSKIVSADNEASNGVVHLIDKILLPETVLNILFPKPSIYELIAETDELSLLNQALTTAGLKNQFDGDAGPFTVFAPSNAAIEELLVLLGDNFNGFEDFDNFLEIELLKRILLFHVIDGNFTSEELVSGEVSTLFTNNSIEIITSGDNFVIGDATDVNANITSIDNIASNGTVHIIDKILVPEEALEFLNLDNISLNSTIKELIETTEEFTILREALSITGLLDTLDENGPYTVFAPNNTTLVSLFGLLGSKFSSLDDFVTDEDISLLRDILAYHITAEKILSSDFTGRTSINTLSNNNSIEFVNDNGNIALVDGLSFEANFTLTDIPAKNGIIHTIDRILIPESVINFIENEVALTFESIMLSAGNVEKEFTFFFPSDKAFIDLFDQIGIEKLKKFTDEEEGIDILKNILAYHCIENTASKASNFQNQQILTTFQGEELEVFINDGIFILDETAQPSELIHADLGILNGYIHVIDKVLLSQEVLDLL